MQPDLRVFSLSPFLLLLCAARLLLHRLPCDLAAPMPSDLRALSRYFHVFLLRAARLMLHRLLLL